MQTMEHGPWLSSTRSIVQSPTPVYTHSRKTKRRIPNTVHAVRCEGTGRRGPRLGGARPRRRASRPRPRRELRPAGARAARASQARASTDAESCDARRLKYLLNISRMRARGGGGGVCVPKTTTKKHIETHRKRERERERERARLGLFYALGRAPRSQNTPSAVSRLSPLARERTSRFFLSRTYDLYSEDAAARPTKRQTQSRSSRSDRGDARCVVGVSESRRAPSFRAETWCQITFVSRSAAIDAFVAACGCFVFLQGNAARLRFVFWGWGKDASSSAREKAFPHQVCLLQKWSPLKNSERRARLPLKRERDAVGSFPLGKTRGTALLCVSTRKKKEAIVRRPGCVCGAVVRVVDAELVPVIRRSSHGEPATQLASTVRFQEPIRTIESVLESHRTRANTF